MDASDAKGDVSGWELLGRQDVRHVHGYLFGVDRDVGGALVGADAGEEQLHVALASGFDRNDSDPVHTELAKLRVGALDALNVV